MIMNVRCPSCSRLHSTAAYGDMIRPVWCCGYRLIMQLVYPMGCSTPVLTVVDVANGQPPSQHLYSVGTWDTERQGFTRDKRLSVRSINVDKATLRQALKELRQWGYDADRVRFDDGTRDSDPYVIVERTDGESYRSILERWKR